MYFRSFAGKVMSFVNFTCPSVTGCPAGLSTFPCTVAFCAIAGAAAPIATTAVAVSKISLQVLIRFLPSCESSRLHPLSTLVWTRETGPSHILPFARGVVLRAAGPTYMYRCPRFNPAQFLVQPGLASLRLRGALRGDHIFHGLRDLHGRGQHLARRGFVLRTHLQQRRKRSGNQIVRVLSLQE